MKLSAFFAVQSFTEGKILGSGKASNLRNLPECVADYESPAEAYVNKAKEYLKHHGIFDGHNDLPLTYTDLSPENQDLSKIDLYKREPAQNAPDNPKQVKSHTSLPLAEEGHLRAQFWSVYWGCSSYQKDAVTWGLEQLDVTRRMIDAHPEMIIPKTAQEAEDLIRNETFSIASVMGLEGGHMIGESLAILRQYYELGIRYMTLTHSCSLPWAVASPDDHKTELGLTDFGKKVINEMNRLGMIVDISHVSHHTMKDVLATSTAPVMFSHSSARALADTHRNVPDDILPLVKTNNGVIMIVFYTDFVKRNAVTQDQDGNYIICVTADDVVDHMMYIGEKIGFEHVGIGGDYNGVSTLPHDADDVSKYPLIMAKLIERLESENYDESKIRSIIQGVASDNILRVWKHVESRAAALKSEGMQPVWEWIPVEDRTWDSSDSNSCKSGREWPVPESPTISPPVGKEPDDDNSSSILALSLPLAILISLF